MRKLALLICLLSPVALAKASPPAPTVSVIRYHYGDNLQGADPTFDESGWVQGQYGRWRLPPFDSDGFVWVRIPVAIPTSASEPLALRWQLLLTFSNETYGTNMHQHRSFLLTRNYGFEL